jgi:hypothetical protein
MKAAFLLVGWVIGLAIVVAAVLGIDWLVMTGINFVAAGHFQVGYWQTVVGVMLVGFFANMFRGGRTK